MMRLFFYGWITSVVLVIVIFGFRGDKSKRTPFEIFDDMDHQPKFKSQATSAFFADGLADRVLVDGTVPFNIKLEDEYLTSGKIDGKWGRGFPISVTEELLQKGKERYNINCAICHGELGLGNGVTTRFGVNGVANYHSDLYYNMPEGKLYNTVVHGKGNMIGLPHLSIEERWAVVAYIRVLQRSQKASLTDVPEEEKENLQ
ncbi:MAG: cytochrome c [Verrucomicrobiota bacterium]